MAALHCADDTLKTRALLDNSKELDRLKDQRLGRFGEYLVLTEVKVDVFF